MKANTRSEQRSKETIARRPFATVARTLSDAGRVRARVNDGWFEAFALVDGGAHARMVRTPVGGGLHSDEVYAGEGGDFAGVDVDGEADVQLVDDALEFVNGVDSVRLEAAPVGFPSQFTSVADGEPSVAMTHRRKDAAALFALEVGDVHLLRAEEGQLTVESWEDEELLGSQSVDVNNTNGAVTQVAQPVVEGVVRSLPDADGFRIHVFNSGPLIVSWSTSAGVWGRHVLPPLNGGILR